MIVVEGPDGAGKTTLITQMSATLGIPVAPRVVSKDAEAMVDLRQWVKDNVTQGFQRTIFDRHRLISEFIYGPTLREAQEPGFSNLNWVSEMMFRFYMGRPILIYCLPPLKTVRKNIRGDLDNQVVWDKIDGIYTAYTHRAAIDQVNYPTGTLIYDYTKDSSADMIMNVHALIKDIRSYHENRPA